MGLYDPHELGGYGLLARNRLFNGKGPTVDCDGAKQWIVEDNQITGVSPMSGGNSIATGESAFMHHLYWGRNRFQFDWGQDREIMTFDGGGIGYGGELAAVDESGTVLTSARLCHPTHIFTGGSVLILNGTGAGQVRRLISWAVAADRSGCTFTIDAPFATKLDPASGQWISAQIFKGASVWEGNQYIDVGSFQFYGMSIDSVVHAEVGQRMTGFHAWGQWHRRADTGDKLWHNQPHPNMHVQFLAIEMLDGNGSPHAGMPMVPSSNFVEGVQFNAAPFTVQGQQRGADGRLFPIQMNRFVVFRSNRISGGNMGFDLGQGYWLSDALCESNVMTGLSHSTQVVDKAGSATGPISHGGGMKLVVRNNSVLAAKSDDDATVHVHWSTNPVLPNSTALVAHSPSASPEMVPDVQLCVGSIDNATGTCSAALTPSVVGFDNISTMFTIPADSPLRVFVYRLRKGAATSAWQAINEPDTCWSIGDRGRVSNAGGSVRVSGRSLAFDRARCLSASSVHVTDSRIRLIPLSGTTAPVELTNVRGSCYDLTADIPADTSPGLYTVAVKNGLAGCRWVSVPDAEPLRILSKETERFAPRLFHVDAGGSIRDALRAAGAAGGGRVTLKSGATYEMLSNETLFIPDRTLLTTAGSGARATIVWKSESPRRPGSAGMCGEREWQDCSMYQHQVDARSGGHPACPALITGNGTFGVVRIHARAPATVFLVEIAAPSQGALVSDNLLQVVGTELCGSGKYVNVANVIHVGQATGFSIARNQIHHANEGRPFAAGAEYGGSKTPAPCGQNSPVAFSIDEGAQDGAFVHNKVACGCNGWYAASTAQLWIENNTIVAVGEFGGIEGSGVESNGPVPRAIHFALLRNRFHGTNAATGPHPSVPNQFNNGTNWVRSPLPLCPSAAGACPSSPALRCLRRGLKSTRHCPSRASPQTADVCVVYFLDLSRCPSR